MRSLRTLRARIALAAAASILAAVVLLAVITVLVVDHELRGSLDSALRQRAQDVAALAISAPAVLTDPGALESPVSGRQISVEVLDAHGRIVARSETLGAEVLPQDALTRAVLSQGRPGAENVEVGGRPLRLYVAPIADAGGPAAGGAVLVASDTSDIAHTTGHLGVVVALAGAGVILLAALVAAALTGKGLAPLRSLADSAGEIERTADPSRRLPEADTPDEIGELTGVLNRMLAALEDARAGERRFLADASHELRTPVTALLGNVEYASRHGVDQELLGELRHDAQRLARLVDSLLALERAGESSASAQGPVALGALTREVAAEHDRERVSLGRVDAITVRGDDQALARALANLIENGLVHGPAGGVVTVELERRGSRALLRVTDTGEGPAPDQYERLFQRFWRGPEAAGRPGAGLGLSIAAAVAASHGGRVSVEGSTFTLELAVDRTVPVEARARREGRRDRGG